MNVTILNDWKFNKDGNTQEGMAAAQELVDYFREREPKVRLSLWLKHRHDLWDREQKEPLRYFHITIFDDFNTFERVRQAPAMHQFVDQLYPEIDRDSHVATECDVVLSNGAELEQITNGETKNVTVINDWKFSKDGDIRAGMQAAAEYVDWLVKNKSELLLSLWLKDRNDPLRYFHITVFDRAEAAEAGKEWEGTLRFAKQLYPHIDEKSVDQQLCDVVLSSGADLRPVPLNV